MRVKSIVLLPKGDIGIKFDGDPPIVSSIANESPLLNESLLGLYAQTLIVPGCELSFIHSATHLDHYLNLFAHSDRTLVFRETPIEGPQTWTIHLPTGPLGITMQGFPPVITGVSDNFVGKPFVSVGFTVQRLIVPGQYDLSLGAGGFTDARVVKVLTETKYVEGRLLVVSNVQVEHPRKQNQMFDFGGFLPSKGWTFRRMFHAGGD